MSKPTAVNPVDDERERLIMSGDEYILKNYKSVVKAIVDGAKLGNRTCQELYVKLVAPIREEHAAHVARAPQPTPVSIKVGLYQIGQNLGDTHAKLELTADEVSAIPPRLRDGLGEGHIKLIPDSPGESASTVALPAPNHTCPDCGAEFYSPQPLAKRCSACKRERSMQKLMDSKRKRGVLRPNEAKLVAVKGL